MAAVARGQRRRSRAPGAASAAAAEDDGEEQHLNPFLSDAAPSSSRVQFRNVASRGRWVEEAGAAEVLDNKGKLWLTTGIARGGKLYYNVEEIGYATCLMKCCNIAAFPGFLLFETAWLLPTFFTSYIMSHSK